MKNARENIALSTGRVIGHEWHENGYQVATPLTGPIGMTDDEWVEYCSIVVKENNPSATVAGRPIKRG